MANELGVTYFSRLLTYPGPAVVVAAPVVARVADARRCTSVVVARLVI